MSGNKLVETIRTIVRTEMAKTLKPLLKEVLKPLVKGIVEGQVNAVLAEKFIKTVGSQQMVMSEQLQLMPQAEQPAQQPPKQSGVQRRQFEESRRAELLKKLGVDDDPMAQLIYGDIDTNQRVAPAGVSGGHAGVHATMLQNGQIYDPEADDDGVDLGALGL